jgi:hypothetical protein
VASGRAAPVVGKDTHNVARHRRRRAGIRAARRRWSARGPAMIAPRIDFFSIKGSGAHNDGWMERGWRRDELGRLALDEGKSWSN